MASAFLGNLIAAVPSDDGFEIYCIDPQPTSTTPDIVVFEKTANGIKDACAFPAANGYRNSSIAVTRWGIATSTQQTSVYYQATSRNLYDYRIDKAGNKYLYNVDYVPTTGATAPALGTSLAAVITGKDGDTVFLFYQSDDKKIYYVWQKALGTWSYPQLVTSVPTEELTSLSAFVWTESDTNANVAIDCVAVAYNQSPGRFMVHTRRDLRRPTSPAKPKNLWPQFEPVVDYTGPATRGPFSANYAYGAADRNGNCECTLPGEYKFFTQLLEDPSRLWAGTLVNNEAGVTSLGYDVVVSNTPLLSTPARGTSIATLYVPPSGATNSSSSLGRMTVIYVSSEGLLAYADIALSEANAGPGK